MGVVSSAIGWSTLCQRPEGIGCFARAGSLRGGGGEGISVDEASAVGMESHHAVVEVTAKTSREVRRRKDGRFRSRVATGTASDCAVVSMHMPASRPLLSHKPLPNIKAPGPLASLPLPPMKLTPSPPPPPADRTHNRLQDAHLTSTPSSPFAPATGA